MKSRFLRHNGIQTLTASGQLVSIGLLLLVFALDFLINSLTDWRFSIIVHVLAVLVFAAFMSILKSSFSFDAQRKKINQEVEKIKATIPAKKA